MPRSDSEGFLSLEGITQVATPVRSNANVINSSNCSTEDTVESTFFLLLKDDRCCASVWSCYFDPDNVSIYYWNTRLGQPRFHIHRSTWFKAHSDAEKFEMTESE